VSFETLRLNGAGGLSLVADVRGAPDAPGVVFLHGGGQTRHSWGGTAEALASDGRRTLNLDMRGHGESEWCPRGRYRVTDFAADLLEVLDTFAQPPVVVGASLGGITALLAAGETDDPHMTGLVLVDISTRIEPEGAQRISNWMMSRPDGFSSLEEVAEAVAEYTRNRKRAVNVRGLEKNVRRGEDGRYRWHWDPKFMQGVEGPSEISDHPRMLRAARGVDMPALLIRGRQSDVISPEGAQEFLDAAPHAEFVDVSGAGHMVAGDRNDAFTEAVRSFLDRTVPLK
jgi:non-heme chloroperoxidase